MNPKISIITVVFNDKNNIEKTIKSVLEQTYNNIEYIIIDGKSTDGTTQIIEKYHNKIDFWLSEPDNGLYDAMNKGLKYATGDYILFLNSGDLLYNKTTIAEVFASSSYKLPDIYYGDAMLIDQNGKNIGLRRHRPPKNLTWKSFVKGMLVSHQAFIPAKKIVVNYNLQYKIAADIDWCIRIMKKANYIHNTNLIIVKFLAGGMSAKRRIKALKERFKIMKIHYGLIPTLWTYLINSFKTLWFLITKGRMM